MGMYYKLALYMYETHLLFFCSKILLLVSLDHFKGKDAPEKFLLLKISWSFKGFLHLMKYTSDNIPLGDGKKVPLCLTSEGPFRL